MTENYHTHTYRCGHAVGQDREYIEAAIERGLKILGFSEHVPMPFPHGRESGYRMKMADTESYFSSLEALREEYKSDIRILIGFEAEYYPKYIEGMLDFLSPYKYDYMILGQHFTDDENESGNFPYCALPTSEERHIARYADEVLEALGTGMFLYPAHPDVINFVGSQDVYQRHMKRLCEGCKKMGIPLEINMLGIMSGRHYPSDRFLRIASEVGNDVIIGCDAHTPSSIADPKILKLARMLASKHGLNVLESLKI